MNKQITQLHNFKNNYDFIRFLASFVIITHAYALKGIEDGNDFLGQLIGARYPFSFFGVRIFFLISGYLILQSFERKNPILIICGKDFFESSLVFLY
jgi:peptidoglycan/LPS O-acetylase OafA/YrhL